MQRCVITDSTCCSLVTLPLYLCHRHTQRYLISFLMKLYTTNNFISLNAQCSMLDVRCFLCLLFSISNDCGTRWPGDIHNTKYPYCFLESNQIMIHACYGLPVMFIALVLLDTSCTTTTIIIMPGLCFTEQSNRFNDYIVDWTKCAQRKP